MKKQVLSILFVTFISFSTSAQYGMDFGIGIGAANYLGEIGGKTGEGSVFLKDMNLKQTNKSVGASFRYGFSPRIAAKLQINYVRIQGADSLSKEPARVARNLSFRTEIFEAMITGEFTYWTIADLKRRSRKRLGFESYVFTGIGGLLYYPFADYNGTWYALRPLATEGIDKQYNQFTLAIPLGIGANLNLNNKFKIGLEIGYRFTFTDYLDDVSSRYASPSDLPYVESVQLADRSAAAYNSGKYDNLPDRLHYGSSETRHPIRGNPGANDGYLMIQANFAMTISGKNKYSRNRYKSRIGNKRARRKF